jgi:hypothetical protein
MVLLHAVNGTDGFTSPPKEVVLRIFITLKNPSPSVGIEPASTLTTTPPRATICITLNRNYSRTFINVKTTGGRSEKVSNKWGAGMLDNFHERLVDSYGWRRRKIS